MHQTFYIDIDEEITSIIERLRKARTKEIVMVVPKRALLIQSIVNLRILKKETDEMDLQLMVVTQDKLGKILIEKAGIFVQQKADNLDDEEIDLEEDGGGSANQLIENEREGLDNRDRLDKIGSSDYFDEDKIKKEIRDRSEKMKKVSGVRKKNEISEREKIINKELVVGVGEDAKKKQASMDISLTNKKQSNISNVNLRKDLSNDFSDEGEFLPSLNDDMQDKKMESFFYQQNNLPRQDNRQEKDNLDNFNLSKKFRNFFWIFGLLVILVAVGIGAYLFLPKATLRIVTKAETKMVDSEVKGNVNLNSSNYEERIIPAKVVSIDGELSKDFSSTGDKSVSNQKARGKITIYNEYDMNPQPLVATTRFLSESGKLFRLIKGVTIPGMTKVGAELKPGTIEAEVIADESGEAYNIEGSKFTIPGFKGSGNEKYVKFYATSLQKMIGGGSNSVEGKVSSVTEGDITLAKNELALELDKVIKEKLKESAGSDSVLIEDAIKKEEAVYNVSNSVGDAVTSFKVTIQMKATTIVVKEKDLKEIVGKMIVAENNNKFSIDESSIVLDFGKPDVNFDAGTINIKFHASGKANPNVDLGTIKKEILGKNEKDLKSYLSTFSDIKEIELNYWPSFISGRIPFRESRVVVILDKQ